MEISHRVGFAKQNSPELLMYLQKHGIKHNETEYVCAFDIYESSEHWDFVSEICERDQLSCLTETVYTKKELAEAQWLMVYCIWRYGYPQPEGTPGFETTTYDGKQCKKCGNEMKQIDDFRVDRTPKWGRRHFFVLNGVEEELFLDDAAKSIFCNESVSGVNYRCVRNKRGTEILSDISQMEILETLPAGLIADSPAIRKVRRCPVCNIAEYEPTSRGPYAFQRNIFDDAPDIVRTNEIIGGICAYKQIVISQRVYQIIMKNHLGASLVFAPLTLV